MKKVILSFLLIGTCVLNSHGQLKVFQNGNTAAKSTLTTSTVGLSVGNKTYGSDYSVYMSASNPAAATYNIGTEGWAYPSTARTTGRTIGVRGVAGNCADGYNYGIMGVLQGTHDGAGIYGTTGDPLGEETGGKYAGYFAGDVKATGMTKAYLASETDHHLRNTSSLQSALLILCALQPLQGKKFYGEVVPPLNSPEGRGEESIQMPTHYGFDTSSTSINAINASYPGLLHTDSNGDTYINYTELIPVLVSAVKELMVQVNSLSMSNSANAGDFDESAVVTSSRMMALPPSGCRLYQNNPNPFNTSTVIRYEIPEDTRDASIYIFDMQGVLLKQARIDPKADRMIINGSEFQPGMYIYSLIVNGQEMDTKRMILSR